MKGCWRKDSSNHPISSYPVFFQHNPAASYWLNKSAKDELRLSFKCLDRDNQTFVSLPSSWSMFSHSPLMDHIYHLLRWPCVLRRPVTTCPGQGRSSTYFSPNIGTLLGSSLWWCAMTSQRSCTRLVTRPSTETGTAVISVCRLSATCHRRLWKMQMRRDRVRWQSANHYSVNRGTNASHLLLPAWSSESWLNISETCWSSLLPSAVDDLQPDNHPLISSKSSSVDDIILLQQKLAVIFLSGVLKVLMVRQKLWSSVHKRFC